MHNETYRDFQIQCMSLGDASFNGAYLYGAKAVNAEGDLLATHGVSEKVVLDRIKWEIDTYLDTGSVFGVQFQYEHPVFKKYVLKYSFHEAADLRRSCVSDEEFANVWDSQSWYLGLCITTDKSPDDELFRNDGALVTCQGKTKQEIKKDFVQKINDIAAKNVQRSV